MQYFKFQNNKYIYEVTEQHWVWVNMFFTVSFFVRVAIA